MKPVRSVIVFILMVLAAGTSLGVSSAGATPSVPWIKVAPSTGLAKGSVVLVTAGGLQRYRNVNVSQCDHFTPNVDPDSELGNCAPTTTLSTDGRGRLRVGVALKDPVSYGVPAGDNEPVYCRSDQCRIFLTWTDRYGVEHAVQSRRLEFTGSPATISATPSTGLAAKQWVRVSGTAFGAEGQWLKIRQQSCYQITQGSGCFGDLPFTWTRVKSDGTYSVSYQALRLLPVADWPGPILGFMDCTDFSERLGNCQMTVAVLNSQGQRDNTFGISEIGHPRGALEFLTP